MIVYLDASALVKRYVAEAGSAEVEALIREAHPAGTVIVSRAEVAAGLARAMRARMVTSEVASKARAAFQADWESMVRVQVGEALAARAATLAWEQGLRGYDAVHLAAALTWRETLDEPLTLATYDRELWRGAQASGLSPWPAVMP